MVYALHICIYAYLPNGCLLYACLRHQNLIKMHPTNDTLDVYSKDFQKNIYENYELLRKAGNVVYVTKSDCWIVLGYNEAKSVLEDNINYSSEQLKTVDSVLLGADNQSHAANKKSVVHNITPLHSGNTHKLNDYSYKVFNLLLEHAKNNNTNNLVQELINPYTFSLALNALGINYIPEAFNIYSEPEMFAQKIENINSLFNNWDNLLEMIDANLTGNLAGAEMQKLIAEINTEKTYNHQELLGFVKLLILAGTETTASLIASSVYTILNNEELKQLIKTDDTALQKFINEVLRKYSPAQFTFRKTTQNTLLAEIEIPKDKVVAVAVGAANRDPDVFTNPVQFTMDRNFRHIAFGTGSHRCIGEHLAMYVAKSFLQRFILLTDEINYAGNCSYNNTLFTFKISGMQTSFKSKLSL